MKPVRMTLSAWGPYKDVQQIDFSGMDRGGLFLVTGPTGAGKTTIFDGITYAMYGEVSGSIREKDSLRSDFANADTPTFVELEFTQNQCSYRIRRNPRYERKKLRGEGTVYETEKAVLWKYTDGEFHLVSDTLAGVYEEIFRMTGLDCIQFKQLSVLAQGEFEELLTKSSRERTRIFRDIFKTRIYDLITGQLAMRVKALEDALKENKTRMDELLTAFRSSDGKYAELMNREVKDYEGLLEAAEAETKDRKTAYENLKTEGKKRELRYQELLTAVEKQKHVNEEIRTYHEMLEQVIRAKEDIKILEKKKQDSEKEYKKISGIQEKLTENSQRLDMIKEQQKHLAEWKHREDELQSCQARYLSLDQEAKEKKSIYERGEDLYRKASAGLLAQTLTEGVPCPVCGNTHHPAPAMLAPEVPDERILKKQKKEAEDAAENATKAHSMAEAAYQLMKSTKENLDETYIKKGPEAALKETEELSEKIRQQIKQDENRVEEIRENDSKTGLELGKKQAFYEAQKDQLKEPEQKEEMDISKLLDDAAAVGEACDQFKKDQNRQFSDLDNNERITEILRTHLKKKRKLEAEYELIREVERAAGGYNGKNLVFEQYVLSVYFDEILEYANRRLRTMTDGRYELYRMDEVKDKRTKEAMELEVLDQYTGRKRSVKSFSGGESFKAALSLALGMSDVISGYAGGIYVETLFVDEGFGSLDSESLEQAVNALTGLNDGTRMIGIISHVEELKMRIEQQIIVEKTSQGSRIVEKY